MDTTTIRGPVLRSSLRANAAPFTPQKYANSNGTSSGSSVHASQPTISRRHSQNPSFSRTPTKRSSIHGHTSFRHPQTSYHALAANNQNNPNAANAQYSTQQKQATSFSSDAFIKRNAAKAYAAKKRAMDLGKAHERRKLDAQKGFARRQSLKQAKKVSAPKSASESSDTLSAQTISTDSALPSIDSCAAVPAPASPVAQPPTSTTASAEATHSSKLANSVPVVTMSSLSGSHSVGASENIEPPAPVPRSPRPTANTAQMQEAAAPCDDTVLRESSVLKPVNTIVHEMRKEAPPPPPPKPSLSIENLVPMDLGPRMPLSAPPPHPKAAVETGASCSVDIGAMSRISNVSSCTSGDSVRYGNTATSRNRESVSMPSSGKWCPECAGVGLHVAAMLAELSQWRADDERRSSQTSSSGASGSLATARSGWKRMMSQTLIGDSRNSRNALERSRLQQQVDVLTTTVQFLYEKLQKADAAGGEVNAAFKRCGIRSMP